MKAIDMAETGKRIRARREELGISVGEVLGRVGLVSQMSVWKWETGRNLPSIDNLINLADVLECQPMDLLVIKEVE